MNLTYAEQRALEIGITIAGGASVILLDEPTAGMSKSETTRFIQLIREVTVGKTLLTVEHDMGVVFGLADKIAVLVYGEVIAFDTPEAVRANAARAGGLPRLGAGRSASCGSAGMSEDMTMLKLANLHAYYGKSHVLHGVSLDVKPGEIVSLLGRNGSGRSTTVKTIMGLVEGQGSVHWSGAEILGQQGLRDRAPRHRLRAREPRHLSQAHRAPEPDARREGRRQEPALVASTTCTRMFPRLKERQHTEAGVLSGGEQQMLTLCRTLMGDPDLIMIDEPTEGLAPKIVELVAEYLQGAQAARHLGAAGRAEAHHRAGDLRALLRDGPRPASCSRARRPSCAPTPTFARSGWRSEAHAASQRASAAYAAPGRH